MTFQERLFALATISFATIVVNLLCEFGAERFQVPMVRMVGCFFHTEHQECASITSSRWLYCDTRRFKN